MVPRSAAANSPGLACTALVKAPRTCPNNWLSSKASGIAPQLMGTNACMCRGPAAWIARATISLPVPLSPVMRTLLGVRLILATCARTLRMAAFSPSRLCSSTACATVWTEALIRTSATAPALHRYSRFSVWRASPDQENSHRKIAIGYSVCGSFDFRLRSEVTFLERPPLTLRHARPSELRSGRDLARPDRDPVVRADVSRRLRRVLRARALAHRARNVRARHRPDSRRSAVLLRAGRGARRQARLRALLQARVLFLPSAGDLRGLARRHVFPRRVSRGAARDRVGRAKARPALDRGHGFLCASGPARTCCGKAR